MPLTTSLSFSNDVAGFSDPQTFGAKCSMICKVLRTKESAHKRSLGVLAVVRATEYMVQTGLAQIASKCPLSKHLKSQAKMSVTMSAPLLGSMSKLTTSQPSSLKALPILPVPAKSSSSLISLYPQKLPKR